MRHENCILVPLARKKTPCSFVLHFIWILQNHLLNTDVMCHNKLDLNCTTDEQNTHLFTRIMCKRIICYFDFSLGFKRN